MSIDSNHPTNLYLIRHGETADDFRGRCYGASDVPLSPRGVQQVEAAAQVLSGCILSAIYCSPRTRCTDSAAIMAAGRGCPVSILSDLAELNFGQFEGKSYAEIEASHPEFYQVWMEHPTEAHFPGGETFSQMRRRVLSAVRMLRKHHRHQSFALVAHGGVNRIVLAEALGLPAKNIFRLAQRYAAINLIRYYGEQDAVVELMNLGAGHFLV